MDTSLWAMANRQEQYERVCAAMSGPMSNEDLVQAYRDLIDRRLADAERCGRNGFPLDADRYRDMARQHQASIDELQGGVS